MTWGKVIHLTSTRLYFVLCKTGPDNFGGLSELSTFKALWSGCSLMWNVIDSDNYDSSACMPVGSQWGRLLKYQDNISGNNSQQILDDVVDKSIVLLLWFRERNFHTEKLLVTFASDKNQKLYSFVTILTLRNLVDWLKCFSLLLKYNSQISCLIF